MTPRSLTPYLFSFFSFGLVLFFLFSSHYSFGHLGIAILSFGLVFQSFKAKDTIPRTNFTNTPALFYLIYLVYIISKVYFSISPERSLSFFISALSGPLVFLLVTTAKKPYNQLHLLVSYLVIFIVLLCLSLNLVIAFSLFRMAPDELISTGISKHIIQETIDWISHPWLLVRNDILLFILALPFLFYSRSIFQNRILLVLHNISITSILITTALSGSRLCYIALVVAVFFSLEKMQFKHYLKFIVLFIAILFTPLLLQSESTLIRFTWLSHRLYSLLFGDPATFADSSLINPRIEDLWLPAWHIFLQNAGTGIGIFSFGSIHSPPWVHNLYLEILTEQGLIGFAIFSSLLAILSSYYFFPAQDKQRASIPDGLRRAYRGSLATFLVAGLFEVSFIREWTYLFFTIYLLPPALDAAFKLRSSKKQLIDETKID